MRTFVLVLTLCAVPIAAAAQSSKRERADALAAEAEALARKGDFVTAAAMFRSAHAIDPRPELLCNVGVAYHKAQDLPRAQLVLGQCLARAGTLDAGFVDAVRAAQAATEAKLREGAFGSVDVVVSPGGTSYTVSLFGEEPIVGSRVVWLPFGTHTLSFHAEGYAEQEQEVVIDRKEQIELRVTLERGVAAAPPSRVGAITATAITGVLAATAAGSYIVARSKASDAGSTTISYDRHVQLRDSARMWQKVSWAFAGAAGVGAIITGILWARSSGSGASIEAAPTGDGGAVWVRGTW